MCVPPASAPFQNLCAVCAVRVVRRRRDPHRYAVAGLNPKTLNPKTLKPYPPLLDHHRYAVAAAAVAAELGIPCLDLQTLIAQVGWGGGAGVCVGGVRGRLRSHDSAGSGLSAHACMGVGRGVGAAALTRRMHGCGAHRSTDIPPYQPYMQTARRLLWAGTCCIPAAADGAEAPTYPTHLACPPANPPICTVDPSRHLLRWPLASCRWPLTFCRWPLACLLACCRAGGGLGRPPAVRRAALHPARPAGPMGPPEAAPGAHVAGDQVGRARPNCRPLAASLSASLHAMHACRRTCTNKHIPEPAWCRYLYM